LTRWGTIAAIAATILAATSAVADEASSENAFSRHAISSVVGVSSYYGEQFDGRRTADGEIFDMHAITAAHKTLPLPCYARVTNLRNGRSLVVRVNDRGPYIEGRMLDVSERVAKLLAYHGGLERVRVDFLGMAGPGGAADQRMLMASLKSGTSHDAVARAKPRDDGVTVAERNAPALGFAEEPAQAPAAAALNAAVRPIAPAPESLGIAGTLDAGLLKLKEAMEAAHATADGAARKLSPYGALVLSPVKPLIHASN
jgi:rare lipoprotein A (peptidoglycan hydrolase)